MATGPKVDLTVLEEHRKKAAAVALHDVAQRAFASLYPKTTEIIAAFETAKLKFVAEGVVHANLWCAVAIAKIMGAPLEVLHKMLDISWATVQPDPTSAGQAAQETAKSRLVGADGQSLGVAPPLDPVEPPAAAPTDEPKPA